MTSPLIPLLTSATLLCANIAALAGDPFRFEKTPGRLPKTVIPKAYQIRIEPSIERQDLSGSEVVTIEITETTRQITLNAVGLQVSHASLTAKLGRALDLQSTPAGADQLLTLTSPSDIEPGEYQLYLDWSGKLKEQPEGLFITRYATGNGEKRAFTTQMEATDARRMFPCWDEPVFRAIYQISAVVPQKFTAISNMPAVSEKPLSDGKKEVVFAPTPSMATYLVAFAAGEFETIEDELAGVKLRIITTEGKKEEGRYALEATKKILAYYNEYFGAPYPLPKLDQFCFPGFAAGGMENWGAIFYNDTTLLIDPKTASVANRQRVFSVVAHEIAHQWFGDLVTMAWWDDLWLNEGFASWMGTKANDHFNPDWEVWLGAAAAKERAMARDARKSTHPIQQPVKSESQASDAFDEITYQKGQSFLRMLEAYLGEERFRAGIRTYIAHHAYGSATTADLWQALSEASGKPVQAIAANWTEQPGFPLVHLATECLQEKLSVKLAQERFTIHQPNAAPLHWKTPIAVATISAFDQPQIALLEQEPVELKLGQCDDLPKANVAGVGYLRVAYEEKTFQKLAATINSLPVAERLNLFADTWALVEAGRVPPASTFDLLRRLAPIEKNFAVWEQMLGVLGFIDQLLLDESSRPAFREWARNLVHPAFARLGWEPKPDESPLDRKLRATLIESLGTWEDPQIMAEATRRFEQFAKDPSSLVADLRSPVLHIAGVAASADRYQTLHEFAVRETGTELKLQLYNALAGSRDSALAEQTLALALTDELLPNEASRLVQRVGESDHPELAWSFAQKHCDALLGKLASIRANDYLPALARVFSDEDHARALEDFARAKLPADAGPSVEKATDDIRFKAEFKKRLLPALNTWLHEPHP